MMERVDMVGRNRCCCACPICTTDFDIKITVSGVDAALCSSCAAGSSDFKATITMAVDGVYTMSRGTSVSPPCSYAHEVTQSSVATLRTFTDPGCDPGTIVSTVVFDDIAIILTGVSATNLGRVRIGVGDNNPNSNIVFNNESAGAHTCFDPPLVVSNTVTCPVDTPSSDGGTVTIERA